MLRARLALIEATKLHLSQFLQRLFGEVFPEYCLWADRNLQPREPTVSREFTTWQHAQSLYSGTEFQDLTTTLRGWARSFNCEQEEWVLDEAWRALWSRHNFPGFSEEEHWGFGHYRPDIFQSKRFKFDWEGWPVQFKTWTMYRAEIQDAFDKVAKEYESKMRAAARAHGLISAPKTHSADNFAWFVLYQLGGQTSVEIAKKIALQGKNSKMPDPSTILKGVRTAQRLIGWRHLRTDLHRSTRKTK